MPQEEKLEVLKSKSELFIGIPKEVHFQENRICLTPDAVATLTAHGHRIMLEAGAGAGARYSDKQYSDAGAQIVRDRAKVFGCPVILKVEPPAPDEIDMMNPQAVLLSALQLKTRDRSYFRLLAQKRITAIGYEFIQDDTNNYPAVTALSEIAGNASILIAAELISHHQNGNGILFGNISGVPPVEVVILGAGCVGEHATRTALAMGASVKVFDHSTTRLRRLQATLTRPVYTSTIEPKNLAKALRRADVAIGAIKGEHRAPVIVSEEMVMGMKKGSIIIDVSIDMGGCFETSELTSHKSPTRIAHNVIHYGVPNISSRYARTASMSISNIFAPYLLEMAEHGGLEHFIRHNKGFKNGLYFYHGILTNRSIAQWFDLPYNDPNLLIF